MKKAFIYHNYFTKGKKCFCRLQLCAMCGLVFMFLLTHIYDSSQSTSQLIYQQEQNIRGLKIILPQADFRRDNDIVEKVYNETEWKVGLSDKPSDVNENKISSHEDNKQQKAQPDQLKNTNQQKIPDKKPSQKENSQQKANSKPDQVNQNVDLGINATHVNGILMEPVNAIYTRNIYFTVKTTHKYYTKRLFPQMVTWLQVVDKNKLSIITDKLASKQIYVDMFRKAGFDIIDTDCSSAYSYVDLSCKLGAEFGSYYNAVERHPGKEDDYQWYCHVDDDMYINVPQLSQFLQQYNPHKPYYFGRWPRMQRGGEANIVLSNHTAYHMSHEANHTLKQMTFQYATGATYCISYAIMMEAKKFFNGPTTYHETYTLAHLPDDMTVGLTIGILLGYNLTEVNDMKNQYDSQYPTNLKDLTKFLAVSHSGQFSRSLKQFESSVNIPQPKWVFLLYHCLLHPTVSWCQRAT